MIPSAPTDITFLLALAVTWIEALPKSEAGKVLKRELKVGNPPS